MYSTSCCQLAGEAGWARVCEEWSGVGLMARESKQRGAFRQKIERWCQIDRLKWLGLTTFSIVFVSLELECLMCHLSKQLLLHWSGLIVFVLGFLVLSAHLCYTKHKGQCRWLCASEANEVRSAEDCEKQCHDSRHVFVQSSKRSRPSMRLMLLSVYLISVLIFLFLLDFVVLTAHLSGSSGAAAGGGASAHPVSTISVVEGIIFGIGGVLFSTVFFIWGGPAWDAQRTAALVELKRKLDKRDEGFWVGWSEDDVCLLAEAGALNQEHALKLLEAVQKSSTKREKLEPIATYVVTGQWEQADRTDCWVWRALDWRKKSATGQSGAEG